MHLVLVDSHHHDLIVIGQEITQLGNIIQTLPVVPGIADTQHQGMTIGDRDRLDTCRSEHLGVETVIDGTDIHVLHERLAHLSLQPTGDCHQVEVLQ